MSRRKGAGTGAVRGARLVPLLRVVVLVLVLVAVLIALNRNWDAVTRDVGRAPAAPLALAGVLALIGPVLTMLGWRVLLTDAGSRVAVPPAAGIFFVGQLGKYLPGSVWTVVAQAEMGAALRIPRRRSTVVGLVSIGLGILTGLLFGLPALPMLLRRDDSGSGWWLVLALPLLALACWPPLLNRAVAVGLRVLRREPLEHDLSGRAVLTSVGLLLGAWLCFALHTMVLAAAVSGSGDVRGLALGAGSGYALAASLGMLAVVAPAGVGVREAILVLLLTSTIPLSSATAVVLLSRLIITLADVLLALLAWLYARTHHLLGRRVNTASMRP